MDKTLGLIFLLVLLLCHKSNTESQSLCPYKCLCFTPAQVLCSDGGISFLPRNLSRKVKEFIIISSDLQYLLSHTLPESPQLTKLIFINNALRSVHSQAFEHLPDLQELEISGNPFLDNLLMGTFENQGNLTKLLLNFNRLETVLPGMFDSLKKLDTLQMKNNILSELPTSLFLNLENLRVLDLSQNKIVGMEKDVFSGLARLETLKMNHNFVNNLTSDTFHNVSQLTELHLESNKISEVPDGIFSVLTQLKVLNLRGNLLTTFSNKVFGDMDSNLQELNLKGNRLTELSSLISLSSLSNLILSSNQLSVLPEDTFRNSTVLEYLDLSENQLTSLPETIFRGLLSLKSIHLSKNNLSTLANKLFKDQEFLEQLYLSDNKLETLPLGLLDPFAINPTVRLHGNPWKCDCHMWYLHDWVLRNNQDIEILDGILCESPGFLRRKPVASIDKDQLLCHLSQDTLVDLSRCSQEAYNDTVVIRCKVGESSPLTVKVQFQEEDGNIKEHVLKSDSEQSNCNN